MRDHAELVKALRCCSKIDARNNGCDSCPYEYCGDDCQNLCGCAADAIEELLAAVPHWISVEERLPEKHVEVLICTEDYGKNELGFAIVAVWDGSDWIETWNREKSIHYVTHWMPLPEPPKGKGR